MGRNVQDFTRQHVNHFRFVAADPETQPAFEDIGDLFVLVRMPGNNGALLEINVRQHHSIAGNQSSLQDIRERFLRYVLPTVMRYASLIHLFVSTSKKQDHNFEPAKLTASSSSSKSTGLARQVQLGLSHQRPDGSR